MIGGEAAHKLTKDEMPSHNHKPNVSFMKNTDILGGYGSPIETVPNDKYFASFTTFSDDVIQNTGGSEPHNNMPPFLAVYVWRRVE